MADIIRKIRCFGVKGTLGYLGRRIADLRMRLFLMRNAKAHPVVPRAGLTVVAEFGASNSLNKTMRDLVIRLHRAGVPYQTLDVTRGARLNREIDGLLTPKKDFRTLAYDHVISMVGVRYPGFPGIEQLRISFWEYASGVTDAFPSLRTGCLAVGMSDFNAKTLRQELGKDRTRELLYPFVFDPPAAVATDEIRTKYRIPAKAFVVFFNFDYTAYSRKNPLGAVRAFAKAFAGNTKVVLVFKTVKGEVYRTHQRELHDTVRMLGIERQFVEIDGYVPLADVYGLTATCDVYLSLHRGEGFGLGIAEAMSLGKCVVVTGFSAPMEFCSPDNARIVPFVLCEPDADALRSIPYPWAVKSWADPDVDAAAEALKALYANPELLKTLGSRAARDLAARFSTAEFRRSVDALLKGIRP